MNLRKLGEDPTMGTGCDRSVLSIDFSRRSRAISMACFTVSISVWRLTGFLSMPKGAEIHRLRSHVSRLVVGNDDDGKIGIIVPERLEKVESVEIEILEPKIKENYARAVAVDSAHALPAFNDILGRDIADAEKVGEALADVFPVIYD